MNKLKNKVTKNNMVTSNTNQVTEKILIEKEKEIRPRLD